MKILVCGGAGYIGSHMVRALQATKHDCVVLDNLSTGHRWAIPNDVELLEVDLLNESALLDVLRGRNFDAVIHFAARSLVGESVVDPAIYYANNVAGTLNLLHAMRQCNINQIVFSSTAAIFGYPQTATINERHPVAPINPYGNSKLMIEWILRDYAEAYGISAVCLRYFNAAGASATELIGEAHEPETHLIPNILKSVLAGEENSQKLSIFGVDYSTRDGTCIRDYVHVDDLADAHIAALNYLCKFPGFHAFNLGNGLGFSVFEVIKSCEVVTGRKVNFEIKPRRAGDPPVLVADSSLASDKLAWHPSYTSLNAIVETAWGWHSAGFPYK